jgi:type II secretory pathway pseudopilin PulG
MFKNERGDTIIEVLLAVTIFSMVAAGALSIMSQGTNTAQRAIEITLVRQHIDSQVEALRAAHHAAATEATIEGTQWEQLTDGVGALSSYDSSQSCPAGDEALDGKSFIINPVNAKKIPISQYETADAEPTLPPFAQLVKASDSDDFTSYGIWIEPSAEGINAATLEPGQYSFRVRACWSTAGLSTPSNLETVVRLYEI